MAKLIFDETKEYENVTQDKASPNGVRLVTSCVRVRVWQFRLELRVPRYLIQRATWDNAYDYRCGSRPDWVSEWLTDKNATREQAIRDAIESIDEYVSHRSFAHADMSEHPAYRDVAPVALATVEAVS